MKVTVKKLSVKTLGIDPSIVKDKTKVPSGLATVAVLSGSAEGKRPYENQKGEIDYGLKGTFEGVNLMSGESYESSVVYLPEVAMAGILPVLEKAIAKAEAEGGDVHPVTFAYAIRVRDDSANAKNARGYVYECINLDPPVENDPLEALRQRVAANMAKMTIEVPIKAIAEPVAEQPKLTPAPTPHKAETRQLAGAGKR